MEDMDAPYGIADHWIIWNLKTGNTTAETKVKGTTGKNAFSSNTYMNSSTLFGMHRYFFRLYVLDITLEADENTGKESLLEVIQEHIIAKTEIMGRYQKEYDYAQVAVA